MQQLLINISVNRSIDPTNCLQALCAISLLQDSKQTRIFSSVFKDESHSASLVTQHSLSGEREIPSHRSARLSIREQAIK